MESRVFSGQDAYAIQKAKTIRGLAAEFLAELAIFDSGLDAAFMQQWQQAITNAEITPSDDVTMSIQTQLTTTVEQNHALCIIAVNDLRYYVGKSFAKDSEEVALYNFKGLARARGSVSRLVVFMMVLHRAATAHAAMLNSNGMTPAQIDALLATANALLQADVEQEYHKHTRLMLTRRRVAQLNAMWGFCQQVHLAARSVFRTSYAKQEMFSLD